MLRFIYIAKVPGWQKFRDGTKGLRQKVWTRTKISSPKHLYILHIVLNYICNFAITRKNDVFVAKIANTRLTKVMWPFLLLPTSVTLHIAKVISLKETRFHPKNFVSRTTAAYCTNVLQLLIVPNRESHWYSMQPEQWYHLIWVCFWLYTLMVLLISPSPTKKIHAHCIV